jgi:exodeoxyribonuclease-1
MRLPIKTLHVNKSPFVVSSLGTLSDMQAERWGVDRTRALQHAALLRDRGRQLDGLWSEVFLPHETIDEDPESNLYGGFVGDSDRRLLVQARQMDANTLADKVHSGRMNFDDPRLNTLLWRYRARHHAECLSDQERMQWEAERAERLNRGGPGRLSLAQYLDRIDSLQAEREDDERAQSVLSDLVDWAETVAP